MARLTTSHFTSLETGSKYINPCLVKWGKDKMLSPSRQWGVSLPVLGTGLSYTPFCLLRKEVEWEHRGNLTRFTTTKSQEIQVQADFI